jgi:hypothetical protein
MTRARLHQFSRHSLNCRSRQQSHMHKLQAGVGEQAVLTQPGPRACRMHARRTTHGSSSSSSGRVRSTLTTIVILPLDTARQQLDQSARGQFAQPSQTRH